MSKPNSSVGLPKPSKDWPTDSPPSRESRSSPHSSGQRLTASRSEKNSAYKRSSTKKWKHRNRRDELFRRLGVDEDVLLASPQITPLLKRNAVRPETLVNVLRCDTEPESLAFVRLWDKLTPADRATGGVEVIAMGAGMTPRRLWELFCGASVVQSKESIGVTIALALPEIMRVAVRGAKKVKGYGDREHIFKAARVLPTPKGSTTIIQVPGQKELPESDDPQYRELEPCDDFLMKTSKAFNAGKALPPAPEADDDEEAEGEE